MEGTWLGIPSIAVSLASRQEFRFEAAARFIARLAAYVLADGLPPDTLLNVNVPVTAAGEPPERFELARLGRRRYGGTIEAKLDPRGRRYYWIGGNEIEGPTEEGTDFAAIAGGAISLTPIHLDLTNHGCWQLLSRLELDWP
jgi:5'-nucleotidase